MSESLGWYEVHNNKNGVMFYIFSRKHREMYQETDSCYSEITIKFIETDFSDDDEWFVESVNINNPDMDEISELAIKVLHSIAKIKPTTIKGMIDLLEEFLLTKATAQ